MNINRVLLMMILLLLSAGTNLAAQPKPGTAGKLKAELYYFHPSERCPIDQSIEETTRKLVTAEFSKHMKDGSLKFQVINTDDKSQLKTSSRFEINAQALYLVTYENGKESRQDLTEFAFSTAQSNPSKFKAELKEDLLKALK